MTNKLERAIKKVVSAWTVAGPVPFYHRRAQSKLRQEWPMLGNAIVTLVAAYKENQNMLLTLNTLDTDPTPSREIKVIRGNVPEFKYGGLQLISDGKIIALISVNCPQSIDEIQDFLSDHQTEVFVRLEHAEEAHYKNERELDGYRINRKTGRILSPGKFENCRLYAPYFYNLSLDPGAVARSYIDPTGREHLFVEITDEDRDLFLGDISNNAEYMHVTETSQGFVICEEITGSDMQRAFDDNARQIDKLLENA